MQGNRDKTKLLEDFPNIKLSYENIVHKKVCADFLIAVPKGKKCYAWFTKDYNTNNNVCYLLELGPKRVITSVKTITCCFHSDLTLNSGTILYGTIFYQEGVRFFTIEDIFYYSGKFMGTNTWLQKLCTLEVLMANDLKQVAYNKHYVIFGLPIMSKTLENVEEQIAKLDYDIYSIQFRCYNKRNTSDTLNYLHFNKNQNDINQTDIVENVKEINVIKEPVIKEPVKIQKQNTFESTAKREKEKIFTVKADIQNDIYHLYENGSSLTGNYVGIAGICDYKTSVMMNNLYRIIKENKNLDSLEESDDEEEFENEKEDRYVDLNKELKFVCQFNYKFKRWCPVRMI